MPEGPGTILGGLPVIAVISFGMTDDERGRDYWSEVDSIHWRKKDGAKGKEIPQAIRDRAEKYDPYFGCLTEQISDHLAGPPSDEMVQLG